MMKFTSKNLVAFAVIAIAAVAFLYIGCSREGGEREPSQPSAQPDIEVPAETVQQKPSRLDDPVYRQALEERRDVRRELLATRRKLVAQMEEKIAAAKERLGTDDEAVLKVELEKDPEWNSLHARVVDILTALEDNRKQAAKIVRDRIAADRQKESGDK